MSPPPQKRLTLKYPQVSRGSWCGLTGITIACLESSKRDLAIRKDANMISGFAKHWSPWLPSVATTAIVFTLAANAMCTGQMATRAPTPAIRTIINYNGAVCVATPNYDLMSNGRIIFKRDGVRFDGSGYFWSPAIPDNLVRRGHYEGRIVGTQNQYWPPLTQTQPSGWQPHRITFQHSASPYFGSGGHPANRSAYRSTATNYPTTTQKSAHFVRCANGSYAVYCR